MTLNFTKMHGLGNDFILIDARTFALENLPELAKRLCHRRFGIGADQVLIFSNSDKAHFRMRIFNSDGGEVEMCGNGIRCLAKYIWDRGISGGSTLDIETLAGIIRPEKAGDLVKVNMGEPVLDAETIPVNLKGMVVDYPILVEDAEFKMTCVSMGNPHAVIFIDNVKDFPVTYYGPKIETHPLFPNRTNVEFAQVVGRDAVRMRVWERGTGETMACGTGAAAVGVASFVKGITGGRTRVTLEAGELLVEWPGKGNLYMTGPAEEVFEGKIEIES